MFMMCSMILFRNYIFMMNACCCLCISGTRLKIFESYSLLSYTIPYRYTSKKKVFETRQTLNFHRLKWCSYYSDLQLLDWPTCLIGNANLKHDVSIFKLKNWWYSLVINVWDHSCIIHFDLARAAEYSSSLYHLNSGLYMTKDQDSAVGLF